MNKTEQTKQILRYALSWAATYGPILSATDWEDMRERMVDKYASQILNEWQPIETAPKDGTWILVKNGVGGINHVRWTNYNGRNSWFDSTYGWCPSAGKWKYSDD